jgi:anti-anti-sigma factor
MNITEREENGIAVFVLEGRVDSEGAVDLDLALQTAVSEGKYKIILDMSQVRYINRQNGGDLRLVDLNPKVARVFQIIGFDKFFNAYDTLEEAKAGL